MPIFHGATEITDGNLYYGNTPIADVYVADAKVWPPPSATWWNGAGTIPDANCIQYLEDVSPATALVETAGIPIASVNSSTVIAYYDVPRHGNDIGQVLYNFSGDNFQGQGLMVHHQSREINLINGFNANVDVTFNYADPDTLRTKVFYVVTSDGATSTRRTVAGTTDRNDSGAALGIGYAPGDLYCYIGANTSGEYPMSANLNNLAIYDIELSTAQINAVMAQLTA